MKKALKDKLIHALPAAFIGNIHGSMGDYVYTSYYGKTFVRSKPKNPTDPKTFAQLRNREGIKLMAHAYNTFKEVIRFSFPERSNTWSPQNAFISANFSTAIDNSGVDTFIDYSKLMVSNGKLPGINVTGAHADKTGISIVYQTELSTTLVSVNDQVVAVAKLKTGELILTKQFRGKEETATIFIPLPGIQPKKVHSCYLFALNADGSSASKSTYVEMVD